MRRVYSVFSENTDLILYDIKISKPPESGIAEIIMTEFTDSLTEKLTAALIAEGAQMLAMTAIIAVLLAMRRKMNLKFTAKSRFTVWKIAIISLCAPLALAVFSAPQIGRAADSVADIIRPDMVISSVNRSENSFENDLGKNSENNFAGTQTDPAHSGTASDQTSGEPQGNHTSGDLPSSVQTGQSGGQISHRPTQRPSVQDGAQNSSSDVDASASEIKGRRFQAMLQSSAEAVLSAGKRAGDIGRNVTANTVGKLAIVLTSVIIVTVSVTVLLLRIAVYRFYIRRLRRMERLGIIRPADSETKRVYLSVCRELDIPEYKAPRLMFAPKTQGAMLCGFLRPAVLIPELDLLIKGNETGLRAVLAHELTHFKRGDLRTQLLCLIARSMHWYNPAVRAAASRCIAELELSCDELVTAGFSSDDRISYGETMIEVLRTTVGTKAPLLAQLDPRTGKEKRRAVKERFMNIFDTTKKLRGRGMVALSLAVIMAAGTLAACTSVGAVIRRDTPTFDKEEKYLVPSYIKYYPDGDIGFLSEVWFEYTPVYNTYALGDDGTTLTDEDGNRIADLGRITTTRIDRHDQRKFFTETIFGRNEATEDISVRHDVFQYGEDGKLVPNRVHEADNSGNSCYSYRYSKNFWKTVNSGYTDDSGLLHKVSVTEYGESRVEYDLAYSGGNLVSAKSVSHDSRSTNDVTENITFELNKNGSPVSKTSVIYEGDSLSSTIVSNASYGSGGNPTEIKDPFQTVTYNYDERGRLISSATLSTENGIGISKNYIYGSGAYATAYDFTIDGEDHDSGNFDEGALTSRYNSAEIMWMYADEQVYTMYRQLCGLSCMPEYANTSLPDPGNGEDIMYLFSIPSVLFADRFGTIFDFDTGGYIQDPDFMSDAIEAINLLPGYITNTEEDISEEDANRAIYYCQLMVHKNYVEDYSLDYMTFTEEQLRDAVKTYLGEFADKILKYDLKKNDAWNGSEGVYNFPLATDYWMQDTKHLNWYSSPKIKISEQDGDMIATADVEIYEGGGIYSGSEEYIGNFRYVFKRIENNGKTSAQLVSIVPTGKKTIIQYEELENGSKYEVSQNPNGTYNFFVYAYSSNSTFSETNLVHMPHIEKIGEYPDWYILKIWIQEGTGLSARRTLYCAVQTGYLEIPGLELSGWLTNVIGEYEFCSLTLESNDDGNFIVQRYMFNKDNKDMEIARFPYDSSDMIDSDLPITEAKMIDEHTVKITYISKSTGETVTSKIMSVQK